MDVEDQIALRDRLLKEEMNKQKEENSNLTSEEKIDKLLYANAMTNFSLNHLSTSINAFCATVNTRMLKIEGDVKTLQEGQIAAASDAEDTKTRVTTLENKVTELQKFVTKTKVETINKDVHYRRYNLVFGGVNDKGAWETQAESEALVRDLIQKINFPVNEADRAHFDHLWDPESIVIKEVHRLPQNPLKFNFSGKNNEGKPQSKNRLLVAKFELMTDISNIIKRSPNLKKINEGKPSHDRIYIDRHLPKCLNDQKKALRSQFNQMKRDGKKPRFRYNFDNGNMYLLFP